MRKNKKNSSFSENFCGKTLKNKKRRYIIRQYNKKAVQEMTCGKIWVLAKKVSVISPVALY